MPYKLEAVIQQLLRFFFCQFIKRPYGEAFRPSGAFDYTVTEQKQSALQV